MLDCEYCVRIAATLESAGCCSRCILRCMGERNYAKYMSKDVVAAEILDRCGLDKPDELLKAERNESNELSPEKDLPPMKRQLYNPCSCCLGVLQSGCDADTVQRIVENVTASKHQFQSFVLQLSMPPSVELREYLIMIYLKEEHRDIFENCPELDIPSVRETWKWSMGPSIGQTFKADFTPKSAFAISLKMTHPDLGKECKPLESSGAFPNLNGRSKTVKTPEEIYTRSSVSKAINKKKDSLKLLYSLPPQIPSCQVKLEQITCTHQPIYLAGRYNKFSRELSQTPWLIDGEKKHESSVEERIVEILLKHVVADKITFSSSGREDVDVRMLGNGRPFVLELMNPKTVLLNKELLRNVQESINNSTEEIAVRDFQEICKDDLMKLKEGEAEKRKVYCALCCINRPITTLDCEKLANTSNVELLQRTPVRVLHRRTQAVRKRMIYNMSLDIKDEFTFLLHVETQAGTYVKEFVHGDFGRTTPSLGELLNAETDIIELDVERVLLDWPPPL